jgi:hypothetical protein
MRRQVRTFEIAEPGKDFVVYSQNQFHGRRNQLGFGGAIA